MIYYHFTDYEKQLWKQRLWKLQLFLRFPNTFYEDFYKLLPTWKNQQNNLNPRHLRMSENPVLLVLWMPPNHLMTQGLKRSAVKKVITREPQSTEF